MSSGVGPGREGRPGNRSLGWARGRNPGESSELSQSSQVGQLTRVKQTRNDGRVQAIQSQDNNLLDDATLPVVSMIAECVPVALEPRYQIAHSFPTPVKP